MQQTLQQILRWSATVTLVLLPIFFLPFAWASIPQAKFALIALTVTVGIGAFVISRLWAQNIQLPMSMTILGAALIPLAYLISALVTGTGLLGFERDTVLAVVMWFGVLLLGLYGFESRARVVKGYGLLLGVISVVTLFQLLRLILGPEALTLGGVLSGPAASVVGSWHDLAIVLAVGVFMGSAYIGSTHAPRGVYKIFMYVGLVLALFTLVIVNMADVWLVLGVASLLFAGFVGWAHVRAGSTTWAQVWKTIHIGLFLLLALVSVFFYFTGSFIHDRLPAPLKVVQVEVRPSWVGTVDVAQNVYRTSGLFFGSGPGTFSEGWVRYRPASVNETAFWNSDFSQGVGFIPTTFATVGVIGVLAWLLFLALFTYEGIRALMRSFRDLSVEPIAVGLFGGATILWVMHVVYAPGVAIMGLAFLLTGLAFSWAVHSGLMANSFIEARALSVRGFSFNAVGAVIGVSVLLSGIFMGRAIAADVYVNKSVVAYNTTGDLAKAQVEIARALSLESKNDRAHRAGVELGLLQLAQLAQQPDADTDPQIQAQLQATLQSAIQHGVAAVESDGGNYQNWLTLAGAYRELAGVEVPGAYERAVEAYQASIGANPTSPAPHLLLAQLELTRGDKEAAKEHIDDALLKKANFGAAHFLRAQIAASEGDNDAALDALVRAAQSEPQEPVVWYQLGTLFYARDEYENAGAALERALILNSNYANALYLLGQVYMQVDRPDYALRVMKRVLELNPGNDEVQAIIGQLETDADKPIQATEPPLETTTETADTE